MTVDRNEWNHRSTIMFALSIDNPFFVPSLCFVVAGTVLLAAGTNMLMGARVR